MLNCKLVVKYNVSSLIPPTERPLHHQERALAIYFSLGKDCHLVVKRNCYMEAMLIYIGKCLITDVYIIIPVQSRALLNKLHIVDTFCEE